MKILAVDLGFGHTKVSFFHPVSGELILDKYITATSKLDSRPDEFDEDNCFQLQENFYVLGAQALKLPRQYLLPLSNYETLKTITPVWVSFLQHKYELDLGVKFDKIAIGLSLAYKDKANDLLEYLEEVLMLPQDTFFCLPQAVASKVALETYGLSLDPAKRTQSKFDSYCLMDLGSNTLDCSLITGSMSSTASSIGLENQGVCKILFDIIDYIYKSTGVQITTDEAKVVLDTGIFRRRGRNYNLGDQVKSFTIKYLIGVLDLMDSNQQISQLVDNVQRVIMIGGGAQLFKKCYQDLIPEIEKRYPLSFICTPEKDSEFMNAISYLLISYKLIGEPK